MTRAWIDGQPASFEEAVRASARLLAESRLPVVTGRPGDIAAIREAARLASLAGAILDHQDSGAIVPALEALRDAGMIMAAPAELRRRADRILVLGSDPFSGASSVFEQIFSAEPDIGSRTKGKAREIVLLGPSEIGRFEAAKGNVHAVPCPEAEIADAVGIIRAALADRRFTDGPLQEGAGRALAGWLKDAGFAAVVFDAAAYGAVDIEMIGGLVSDLNVATRASALPLLPSGSYGAAQAATWTTGFPLRTAFGSGAPEHDMALNEAARRLETGEADMLLLIAPDGGEDVLASHGAVPTILLTSGEPPSGGAPKIAFAIGRPGADHPATIHEPRFGSLITIPASAASDAPAAATVLRAIADALDTSIGQAAA